MESVDVVVIGAGVIGLAVARALAFQGREPIILEAADQIGTGASSRNSEVVHSGLYYPPGSLKARLCVVGRDLLYSFCDQYGIENLQCGKLIVATCEEQLGELSKLRETARANGVHLESLAPDRARLLEPQLSCVGALHSPVTGIIDSHAFLLALLGQAESRSAVLVCQSRATRMWLNRGGVFVAVNDESLILRARLVINCAGLSAPQVARSIVGFADERIPTAYFAKGHYFTLAQRSPFRHLIYPVPEHGGLGIHLTLDLAGRARFGPDVNWIKRPDYTVEGERSEVFYPAIRKYWPDLPDGALQPGYAGIRAKIAGPLEPAADFRIDGAATHGSTAVINLFGIESPGLTASLAIAEHVAQLATEQTH